MARPSTGKGEQLHIRVSEDELARLSSLSETLGVSKSDAVRLLLNIAVGYDMLLAKGVPTFIIFHTTDASKLLTEMRTQGRNLNQLTRAMSSLALNRTEVSARNVEDFRRDVNALKRKYGEISDKIENFAYDVMGV